MYYTFIMKNYFTKEQMLSNIYSVCDDTRDYLFTVNKIVFSIKQDWKLIILTLRGLFHTHKIHNFPPALFFISSYFLLSTPSLYRPHLQICNLIICDFVFIRIVFFFSLWLLSGWMFSDLHNLPLCIFTFRN